MTNEQLKYARLCMKIAEVWLQATGEQFVDAKADPFEQLDRISRELSQTKLPE